MRRLSTLLSFVFMTSLVLTSSAVAASKKLTVASKDFKQGGYLPNGSAYPDCRGKNTSPQISWKKVPPGTVSFALVMKDQQARFYHWGIYNIPASTTSLNRGVTITDPIKQTLNDFYETGYGGPCPDRTHNYTFTVYALSATLSLPEDAEAKDVEVAAKAAKPLATGSIAGRWPRP